MELDKNKRQALVNDAVDELIQIFKEHFYHHENQIELILHTLATTAVSLICGSDMSPKDKIEIMQELNDNQMKIAISYCDLALAALSD